MLKESDRVSSGAIHHYPTKVIQFGEGNFLRAFVDWMIQKANERIQLKAAVVIVQPLEKGMVDLLKNQNHQYHVMLQGIKDGQAVSETELIECIKDSVNPYTDYEVYRNYFLDPELELVVSNTTEAGISRIDHEDINAFPPKSFPGKICQLLYQRFKHYDGDKDKGLTFFCCELIDKNASVLREIVLELAAENDLGQEFIDWIQTSCQFCNTLVDRIVPGFPKDNIEQIQKDLPFEDKLIVKGEYFHLWAIEAPQKVRDRFPFDKAGLNVVWLEDITQFRDKKVRILNGSHTALVPLGLLSGYQTVKEAFDDELISEFINKMVAQEVIPNIQGNGDELMKFSSEILERFHNPFIRHFLKDISLNSLSKWMTRNYPSLLDSFNREGQLPSRLTFSLAALLVLYKGEYGGLRFQISDTPQSVEMIQKEWGNVNPVEELISNILSKEDIWGINLDKIKGLSAKVTDFVKMILERGMKQALQEVV